MTQQILFIKIIWVIGIIAVTKPPHLDIIHKPRLSF